VPREKLLPGGFSLPLRRRLDAMPLQNLSDRAAGKLVPQIGQGALDAPIAPIPVLFGHPCHQRFDVAGGTRSPRSALATAVVFLSDQLAMPGQQSLWRYNRGELRQKFPPQAFGLGGQAPALTVGEPQPSSAELCSQNAILLAPIVNDEQLMLVHPAGDGDQQKPEWGPGLSASCEPIIASLQRSAAAEDSSRSDFRTITHRLRRAGLIAAGVPVVLAGGDYNVVLRTY